MSSPEAIERSFRAAVSAEIDLLPAGIDRYRVATPFRLDDGDHIVVVLRRDAEGWLLTDEGNTYMKLTYEIEERDLRQGGRAALIEKALAAYHVEDREGELVLRVPGERFGDALYSFVQAILKISDVTYLSRERARSTFIEDVRGLLFERLPSERVQVDWTHPTKDPERRSVVDYYINGQSRPLVVFALPSDDKVRDATITLLNLERWGMRFRSLGIFENQVEINRGVLARFTDVCEKEFSSLSTAKERLELFLRDAITTL